MPALLIAALLAAVPISPGVPPPADLEDKAVLDTTRKLFEGMAAADPAAMRPYLLPDAQMMAVRTTPDGKVQIRRVTFEESMGKHLDPGVVERMWSPIIVRRGPLATVTGPYEVTKDGKTVHCGIDIFTLVKQEDAWKVASISWTAEPDACPELRQL